MPGDGADLVPAPDPFAELERVARTIWDYAKLYPQDGGIVVVIDHAHFAALGAALEAMPRRPRHRKVIVQRGSRAGSAIDLQARCDLTPPSPGPAPAPGREEQEA